MNDGLPVRLRDHEGMGGGAAESAMEKRPVARVPGGTGPDDSPPVFAGFHSVTVVE